jgi:hypothetical protein
MMKHRFGRATLAAIMTVTVSLASGARVIVAADDGLPLPAAPLRVVIPDVAAFDAALTGGYRRALTGRPEDGDPVTAAWRRSPVGSKLEAQWTLLSGDLPWTWDQILELRPRALSLALLSIGSLEAVLVVATPLAALPVAPPSGEAKAHGGIGYHLVAAGAADGSADPERRAGLAWSLHGGRLFLATSERALLLALDEALAGHGFPAPLPGLVSLDLDLDALRKDRYFRREFLFGDGREEGHVKAALRLERGHLVEIREGAGESGTAAFAFDAPGAIASAWEPDGTGLWPALRAALLEPWPALVDRPVPPFSALPSVRRVNEGRYLLNLEKAPAADAAWEEGDLALWHTVSSGAPVPGFGMSLYPDEERRLVFAWPADRQDALEKACRATIERRGGRVEVVDVGDAREFRVGPDLAVLAVRRAGAFVWLGRSAKALADVAAPRPAPEVVRWGRADLGTVRAEAVRWQKAEGPAAPERLRPLSDRVLGLLGWMPAITSIELERRRTSGGWTERLVFGTAPR